MKRELFSKLVAITIDRITSINAEYEDSQVLDLAKDDVMYFFGIEESDLIDGVLDETDVIPYLQYVQIYLDNMNMEY